MAQGQPTKVKKKKKSVLKRAAQARQRAQVNRINRTRVRTMMRRFRTALPSSESRSSSSRVFLFFSKRPNHKGLPLQLAGSLVVAEPDMSYYALFYDTVDDYVARRAEFREMHLLMAREVRERGELLLA